MKRILACLGGVLLGLAPLAAAEPPGRVVILGFDGVDAAVVEEMLSRGQLPNLAALKARGGYSPADADRPGADAGVLGDVLDGARSRRPRDLRLSQARSGQPDPHLRGRRGEVRPAPPRESAIRWRSRRGAGALPPPGPPALRSAPARGRRGPRGPRRRGGRRGVSRRPGLAADDAALGQEQPPGSRVLGRSRRAPGHGHPHARHLSARGVRGRADALGARRARRLRPDRTARLLHVGPVLRAARGQRLLGRDRPPRIQRRPPAGPRPRPARPGLRPGRNDRLLADADGPRRARPDRRRDRRRARRAQGRAVERLAAARFPRQPARRDPRLRAHAPGERPARDRPLPLARAVRSGAPAARLHDLLSAGLRRGTRPRVRPLQDDGLGHRHLVDPVGHAPGGRLPRGREDDGGPGAQDAAGDARAQGPPPLPLLRVPGPRRPRLLALPRPGAPGVRREARGEVRRRRREVLRRHGRDRGGDGRLARAAGRADRPLGPRIRDLAAVRELQLLARRERLPRVEGQRETAEPRGPLLPRPVLGGGRLDEVEGLRDGARRHLRQPVRAGKPAASSRPARSTTPCAPSSRRA